MNVLITCAGRRTSLLSEFVKAARRREGIVAAADTDALAPAVMLADTAVRMPPLRDSSYISVLEGAIRDMHADLVVPTIDTELLLLATYKERLERNGCTVLVSASNLVEILRDKFVMASVFSRHGIRVPACWVPGSINASDLPDALFVKPRDGSASKHVYRLRRSQLDAVLPMVPSPMVQEEIQGPEITVDGLLDMAGRCVHYVPRRRVKTLAGESVQSVTIDDSDIREWLLAVFGILGSMGGIGPMTVQAFLTDDGPVLSEINPRFGGGVPLAFAAGGHYPEWILQMLGGEHVESRIGEYTKGLWMTRHHIEVFTERPLWDQ
ncbi:MAG: carbamoyl phosphate synthase-like protein [Firmicutes bacterium ADurb.BinA052]|nr:MAG: carbamoyl phosphate synthase-like protein [Firmicutes bacterium ADurb.BinA052]